MCIGFTWAEFLHPCHQCFIGVSHVKRFSRFSPHKQNTASTFKAEQRTAHTTNADVGKTCIRRNLAPSICRPTVIALLGPTCAQNGPETIQAPEGQATPLHVSSQENSPA